MGRTWIRRTGPVLAALVLTGSALPVAAQPLATRPIRLILPYTPGGPVDLSARIPVDAIAPIHRLAPITPHLILCYIAQRVLGLPKSY